MATDSELLEFLLTHMQGDSLHMNGTMGWRLPHRVTWNYRAKTAREAVELAYQEHVQWCNQAQREHGKQLPDP